MWFANTISKTITKLHNICMVNVQYINKNKDIPTYMVYAEL